jgi:flagellar protein FliS
MSMQVVSGVETQDAQGGLVERGQVLLALYEGAIGFLRHAVVAHERGDGERFNHYVGRAEKVVHELSVTLDREQGGELATMLEQLYEYMQFRLQEASRTGAVEPLADVTSQLGRIYDSYRQVINGLQQAPHSSAAEGR